MPDPPATYLEYHDAWRRYAVALLTEAILAMDDVADIRVAITQARRIDERHFAELASRVPHVAAWSADVEPADDDTALPLDTLHEKTQAAEARCIAKDAAMEE